jgi:hypothetical protein
LNEISLAEATVADMVEELGRRSDVVVIVMKQPHKSKPGRFVMTCFGQGDSMTAVSLLTFARWRFMKEVMELNPEANHTLKRQRQRGLLVKGQTDGPSLRMRERLAAVYLVSLLVVSGFWIWLLG